MTSERNIRSLYFSNAFLSKNALMHEPQSVNSIMNHLDDIIKLAIKYTATYDYFAQESK